MKDYHTPLSLMGNAPQQGKGLGADILGGIGGALGGIAGSVLGPIGGGAGAGAGGYAGKWLGEQLGLGYQYKSPIIKSGLWGYNATGPCSMNMPDR